MSNPRSPESHSLEFPKLTSAAKADAAGVGRFSIAALASGGEAAHSSQMPVHASSMPVLASPMHA